MNWNRWTISIGIGGRIKSEWVAVLRRNMHGVHPRQRDYAWGVIAEGCERVTRYEGLSCQSKAGEFVKSVLLEAARHPDPAYSSGIDASFNEFPSWGSPAARIDAAKGLTRLARFSNCVDQELLEAIKQLSQDEVPAVRYQVAAGLLALYQTVPGLMWERTRSAELFCYLEYTSLLNKKLPVLTLDELRFNITKEEVKCLMHGLRLLYIERPGMYGRIVPVIETAPVIFIQTKYGFWWRKIPLIPMLGKVLDMVKSLLQGEIVICALFLNQGIRIIVLTVK